ncbi:MAG: hypothetical protein ABIF77_17900 [bacterium]
MASANSYDYCIDFNGKLLMGSGMSPEDLETLRSDPAFTAVQGTAQVTIHPEPAPPRHCCAGRCGLIRFCIDRTF